MESIQSKLLKMILRIINLKKMWEVTGNELRKNIEKKQLSESHEPPKKIQRNFKIKKKQVNGYCCYIIKPLNSVGQKHVLYLHGGGFVYEIMSPHWEFLARIIDELKCTIIVPIYPLAPQHQHQEVFDMILLIYQQIILKVKPESVVIMGDSAGGGMSLSLAQLLKEKELPQPRNIILISPTLDMTFSNPEIHAVEKLDPVSAVPALIDIIKWYSGEKDSKHYLISPIYGNFEGLGKISLFIGTHDILYPDAKKFKNISDLKGIEIDYYEYPSMIHVWPLFFFPESKKATKQIIEIIRSS
ncbi:alpha/beta hydrolase [Clostridium gasigenes]|uniref:alpha/beta hydrolase n=1 Tax=Clostridium gasigenes TaxID=94869 RepID=UPI0014386267|nr:alpha/beta hydrolase [Clostridium gasigenes]NKF07236.1 alpha/beta hydrolase [Clostridium gasigenes]QSW18215.1 alpha/beta hydrolase [Clostridium gasigenes]